MEIYRQRTTDSTMVDECYVKKRINWKLRQKVLVSPLYWRTICFLQYNFTTQFFNIPILYLFIHRRNLIIILIYILLKVLRFINSIRKKIVRNISWPLSVKSWYIDSINNFKNIKRSEIFNRVIVACIRLVS